MTSSTTGRQAPRARLARSLRSTGFELILTVPCSVMSAWLSDDVEQGLPMVTVTREEEAVGIASGLVIAGRTPVICMQNSGLGNAANALASLTIASSIPLVVVLSLRGDEVDDNPVQRVMGQATEGIIAALGCTFLRVDSFDAVTQVLSAAKGRAVKEERPVFVLLPRIEALC